MRRAFFFETMQRKFLNIRLKPVFIEMLKNGSIAIRTLAIEQIIIEALFLCVLKIKSESKEQRYIF